MNIYCSQKLHTWCKFCSRCINSSFFCCNCLSSSIILSAWASTWSAKTLAYLQDKLQIKFINERLSEKTLHKSLIKHKNINLTFRNGSSNLNFLFLMSISYHWHLPFWTEVKEKIIFSQYTTQYSLSSGRYCK